MTLPAEPGMNRLQALRWALRRHRLPEASRRLRWASRATEEVLGHAHPLLNAARRAAGASAFVIFHNARSGSTVLSDMLDQHAACYCDGEIYLCAYRQVAGGGLQPEHRRMWRWARSRFFPDEPLRFLRSRMPLAGLRRRYGFEVKLHDVQGNGLDLPAFIRALEAASVTHFITLRRRNGLRRIASRLRSSETGRSHRRRGEQPRDTSVRLNVEDVEYDEQAASLQRSLEMNAAYFGELGCLLQGRAHLDLVYEDDIAAGPRQAYRRCCRFLGLAPEPVDVRFRRTTPFPLRQVIENMDDVRAHLRGTPFAWMAEPPTP